MEIGRKERHREGRQTGRWRRQTGMEIGGKERHRDDRLTGGQTGRERGQTDSDGVRQEGERAGRQGWR